MVTTNHVVFLTMDHNNVYFLISFCTSYAIWHAYTWKIKSCTSIDVRKNKNCAHHVTCKKVARQLTSNEKLQHVLLKILIIINIRLMCFLYASSTNLLVWTWTCLWQIVMKFGSTSQGNLVTHQGDVIIHLMHQLFNLWGYS